MSILLTIGIVILVIWLIFVIFFRSLGCLIHIALAVGLVLLILWLLSNVFHLISLPGFLS